MRNWLIILFLFTNYISFSQSNILIKKQEIDNLSSEKVNSIFVDNKTFSWISTPEGLNRFDGDNNVVFRSNPFDSTTINDNNIATCNHQRTPENINHSVDVSKFNKRLKTRTISVEKGMTPTVRLSSKKS